VAIGEKGSPRCVGGGGLFLPLIDLGALLSYRLNILLFKF